MAQSIRVAQHELVEDVVKHALPADDPDAEDWRLYPGVCEVFRNWDRARAAYEKLVADEPDTPSHRIRLALTTAHDDPEPPISC